MFVFVFAGASIWLSGSSCTRYKNKASRTSKENLVLLQSPLILSKSTVTEVRSVFSICLISKLLFVLAEFLGVITEIFRVIYHTLFCLYLWEPRVKLCETYGVHLHYDENTHVLATHIWQMSSSKLLAQIPELSCLVLFCFYSTLLLLKNSLILNIVWCIFTVFTTWIEV